MEESSTYHAIFQEGFERGFRKGWRKIMIRAGKIKFGYPNDAIVAKLNSIDDLEQLEMLANKLLFVDNWVQLLADE